LVMKIILPFLFVSLLSFPLFAEEIPGQKLLSYFSSNCRTQGEWTRAALADSTALIEALRNISQDPDCKSVGGAVTQLGLLNQQLSQLDKTNETQTKLAELNSQEQELLIQISNNTDPSTLASINSKLRDLQLLRAGLIGREKAQAELAAPDKAEILTGVVQIANTTFSQITGNQKCLNKHPNLLNTATSIMSSVGATAAVINPALGLGLTAGSSFLGETIEGLRRNYTARQIRKISDNSIAVEAYKCALETMSERWCQMRDAEAFLIFKARERKHPALTSGLGAAIRLNDRELPVLLEWLNKIRSGVTPTTTADAGRQSAVFTRETYVRSLEANGYGLIEENRKIYNTYTDLNERWNFLRSVIRSLLPPVETPFRNPFYDVYSAGYAPFFLLGLPDDGSIRNPQGDYFSILSWAKPNGFNPTLDLVKERYSEWVARARTRVNQELTQVLQPDALQTLSSAYDRSGNRWKISPMDSLKRIIDFLEKNPPRDRDFAFKKLYANTLAKLKDIHAVTEEAIMLQEMDDLSGNTTSVERVYDIAQLRYGTVVMEARLDMIVRLSLLELLESSPQEDQVVVAQLLAAERFTETISKMSGTDNLALIRADINRAQPVTISNLNSFIDIFGDNITRILSRLSFEEKNATGTIARMKRYARTEMCFLLLTVPDAARYVDIKYCEGVKLNAIIDGGPESRSISSSTFKLDINERACEYREFFRKSKIYETWGIK
jgi:hypothetical protein